MTPTCPVCGSADLFEWHAAQIHRLEDVSFSYSFRPEHSRTFRVVRCRGCTHAFCSPLPEAVASRYEDVVDEEYLKHQKSRELAALAVLRVVRATVPTGALLDVGCAVGDFMQAARGAEFRPEGLELSAWSCEIARQRGFVVHQERLATFAAKNAGRFDVVVLNGVIEHFADPASEMSSIATVLRPGGVVVIWTGDVDGLPSRLLGRKWWYWQGQHIQYFTHASLKALLQRCGFEHVETKRYPFAANYETLSNSLRRYRLRPLILALIWPVLLLKPTIYLRLPGEMLLVARRLAS